MKHFGAIANVGRSHLQTMCTIGQILQERGHRFTLFGTSSQARDAGRYGVQCVVLGPEEPAAELFLQLERGKSGFMSAYLAYMKNMAAFLCARAPAVLVAEHVEFLLADQEEPGASTAADLVGIPYITICSSVPMNEDPWVPPSFVSWGGSARLWARLKNKAAYQIRNLAVSGVNEAVNRYRRIAQLREYRRPDDSFSGIAQISQLVKEFDFAREGANSRLRYVGPFQRHSKRIIPFCYELLDGRPLIYAAFGTVKGDMIRHFHTIADACATLRVQLVIALGGAEPNQLHARLAGSPIVVSYAPQLKLLSRASAFITHAGVNSTMEALSMGVPLIAFPQNGDQFGMAARIAHHNVGKVLHARSFRVPVLREAINDVTQLQLYRASAARIQHAIAASGGASQAADIIESLSG